MEHLGRQAVPQTSVQVLQTSASVGPQIFLAILAVFVAPVTEELLFRGILYPFIKQRGYPNLALWGTAVLFGALHLNLMTFVPLTFLGVVLAWLYDTTDNLAAPIFAHSLFNLANFFRAVWEPQF
ncbi:MAG: CPBP family intramembrane metalloprotease [Verrucomicrobia bacterium]|nr:MAG: CPBP family intramembrane metalloprotease [Verrucomicrobiota bacterium]